MEQSNAVSQPTESLTLNQLNQLLTQANKEIIELEQERSSLIDELREARRQLFTMRGA